MQPPENSIHSFSQVLRLYQYTRQNSQKDPATKVLHNKLTEFIKGIIKDAPTVMQTANQLKGQLNARVKVLKENSAIAQNDGTNFDLKALKKSLVKHYCDKKDDQPTAEEFIQLLNEECSEVGDAVQSAPAPLNLLEMLGSSGIHVPTALERATGNTDYNRGKFGCTSKLMRHILEGGEIEPFEEDKGNEGPDDADDLSRCVYYVEDYLRGKNRPSLTEDEKAKISARSRNWAGVMEHWNELSDAINHRMPFPQVKTLLHECMNGAKLVYGENEVKQITSAEKEEIIEFCRNATDQFDLKNRTRVFANQLIKALHANSFYIAYSFVNKGMVEGVMPLSRGRSISFLNRTDFSYIEKKLIVRPRTPADDVDEQVTRVTNRSIQISF